jgi:hypothetical protein
VQWLRFARWPYVHDLDLLLDGNDRPLRRLVAPVAGAPDFLVALSSAASI